MYEYSAKVICVYDGDTIWVDLDLVSGWEIKKRSIKEMLLSEGLAIEYMADG